MSLVMVVRTVLFSAAIIFSAPALPTSVTYALSPDQRDSWYDEEPSESYDGKVILGLATWYDATKNNAWYTLPNKWGDAIKLYGAAGPKLRKIMGHKYMGKPYAIRITSLVSGESAKVWVADYCGCQGRKKDPDDTRLIDLAPEVWERLGVDLGRGVMKVSIEILD